jgi:hypothetical protein
MLIRKERAFCEGEFKNSFSHSMWHTRSGMNIIELLQHKYQPPKQAYQLMCNPKYLNYCQLV